MPVRDSTGATLVHYKTFDKGNTVDLPMALFKIATIKSKGIEQYPGRHA